MTSIYLFRDHQGRFKYAYSGGTVFKFVNIFLFYLVNIMLTSIIMLVFLGSLRTIIITAHIIIISL